MWYYVDTGFGVCAVRVREDGVIIETCPLLKKWIGAPFHMLKGKKVKISDS